MKCFNYYEETEGDQSSVIFSKTSYWLHCKAIAAQVPLRL